MRPFSLLLMVVALSFIPSSGLSSQANTTFTTTAISLSTQSSTLAIGETTYSALTTSTYGIATGTVPASFTSDTGQQICYYLSYPFHVDESVSRIIGTVSASTPVNFYLMSKAQYDEFVSKNPPCGSSYTALFLDYLKRSVVIDWKLGPGDYYILVENISISTVTYTVDISAIGNASSELYSTEQIILLFTSTGRYVSGLSTQSSSGTTQSNSGSYELPIAITAALFVALVVFLYRRHHQKIIKEEGTRIY
jgi:hypothetical protein